jgi:hypothetical protein
MAACVAEPRVCRCCCRRLRRLVVDPHGGERVDDRAGSQQVLDREAETAVSARSTGRDNGDNESATQLGLATQGERGNIRRFLHRGRHQFDTATAAAEQRHRPVDRVTGASAAELVDPDHDVRTVRNGRSTGRAPIESDLIAALAVRGAHATRLATHAESGQDAADWRHDAARNRARR